ncbi:MAG: hypothetical protein IT228_15715 [Flavobacteriales bacterium]|nr:hypothetical protein [Flavobacteriales bacterium]
MARNLIALLLVVLALVACTKEQIAPAAQVLPGEDKRLMEVTDGRVRGAAREQKEDAGMPGLVVRAGETGDEGGGDDGISDDGDEDADGERNKKRNNATAGN